MTYTIVGVLPREFAFAPRGNAEFWVPLLDKTGCEQRRSCHNLDGVGRLRDGVTMQAALAEMKAIAAQLAKQYPGLEPGAGRERDAAFGTDRGQGAADSADAAGGAGLLLLIACVNVASLLLVRSESRTARDCGARRAGRNAGATGAAVRDRRIAAGGGGLRRRDCWWRAG